MYHQMLRLVALLVAGFSVAIAFNTEPGRLGCYEDHSSHVWQQWQNTHEKNTVHFCKNMCQDFKFAGLGSGIHCMCGDEIPPKAIPDSRCNMPCSGDASQTCGGGWAIEVFPVDPKPVLVGKPMGCFQDSANRVWKTGLIKLQSNTRQRCINACRGFRYAGMEAGTWCVCGDILPTTSLESEKCKSQCSGLPGKTCGGDWALDVFELSEVPDSVKVLGCIPIDYESRGNLGIYKTYIERKTWDEAWQQCENDDAHLLIINSEEEAKFVRSIFAQLPSETRMHAGFHDLFRKGTYRALFGKSLQAAGYNVWSEQHPQVASDVQHCGSLDVNAHLAQIDGNCAEKSVFICEKKSNSSDIDEGCNQIDVRTALGDRGLEN